MKPFQLVPDGTNNILVIPANEDMLATARLYLEKYELLADEDRRLYREVIRTFNEGRIAQFIEGLGVTQ
jgi:hypothetical protein